MSALSPFQGTFGRAEAWHLLRRTTFGVGAERVTSAVNLGLSATLDQLFGPDTPIGPPLNYQEDVDPNVPVGQTWVRAPYVAGIQVNTYRQASLTGWTFANFYKSGFSLERRMLLFWFNHFGVARSSDMRVPYNYYETLRAGILGSFPDLIKLVAVEPQMLIFLDGKDNTASSPNENFARELLELFTIGKGPLVGSGDYTNYTEDDVRSFARALTGWRQRNAGSTDATKQPEAYFTASRHDSGVKQLSHRFDNLSLSNTGGQEYQAVVDMIFSRPNAGDYLCRKLYRWFVYYDIDDQIEQDVIQPMATAFRDSGYQVGVPLRLLLSSEHFFEARFRGALVKSPLDEVIDTTAGLGLELPSLLGDEYWLMQRLHTSIDQQEMRLFEPPSVAGFKAFYQAPLFNRFWLNASTLQLRSSHTRSAIVTGFRRGREIYKPDLLAYIATFDNPTDPNDLVAELAERLLPVPLDSPQLIALKGVLIPGLPDFEWTIEYGDFLANPNDENMRRAISGKLVELFGAVLGSAEFHLY